MSQVTVISGVERRRVWSDEQKRALVAAACEPGIVSEAIMLGASVENVAGRYRICSPLVYR